MAKRKLLKTAVLASGRGTSLKPSIEAWRARSLRVDFVSIGSDRADAPILLRAKENNIPAFSVPSSGRSREEQEKEIINQLKGAGTEVILLVGYMRILSGEFISLWPNRIFNIHPSLLPLHRGLMDRAIHETVLKNREKESGCTLHAVTSEVDAGPTVVQERCPVLPEENVDSLRTKVQNLEARILLRFLTDPEKFLNALDRTK